MALRLKSSKAPLLGGKKQSAGFRIPFGWFVLICVLTALAVVLLRIGRFDFVTP